jgi:hypothetical protein
MARSKIVRYHSEGPGDRRDLVSFIRTRAILIHLLAEQDRNHRAALLQAAERLRQAAEDLEPWAADGIPPTAPEG